MLPGSDAARNFAFFHIYIHFTIGPADASMKAANSGKLYKSCLLSYNS